MKYIKIEAKLTLKQFREFKYSTIEKKYRKTLNNIFGDEDRLYLPFEKDVKIIKPLKDIKKFLNTQGYEIVDYGKGVAVSKDKKNLFKIGKILKKNKKNVENVY